MGLVDTVKRLSNNISEKTNPFHKQHRKVQKTVWGVGKDKQLPWEPVNVAEPAATPMPDEEEIAKARRRSAARQRSGSGRASTMLGGTATPTGG